MKTDELLHVRIMDFMDIKNVKERNPDVLVGRDFCPDGAEGGLSKSLGGVGPSPANSMVLERLQIHQITLSLKSTVRCSIALSLAVAAVHQMVMKEVRWP